MKDGKDTSEYKVMNKAFWTAIILPLMAAAISSLQNSGAIQNPTALAVIGVVGAVLSALGYGAARTIQKGQEQKRESVTIASMMAANQLKPAEASIEKKQ